jgi:hypothetical protein
MQAAETLTKGRQLSAMASLEASILSVAELYTVNYGKDLNPAIPIPLSFKGVIRIHEKNSFRLFNPLQYQVCPLCGCG